jgi:hypothetical protein
MEGALKQHDMSLRKLSEWLELAVQDLKMVMQDSRYTPHMDYFLATLHSDTCYVCLAGSILVGAGLERWTPTGKMTDITHGDEDLAGLLFAIDRLRRGRLRAAIANVRKNRYITESDWKRVEELFQPEQTLPDFEEEMASWELSAPNNDPFFEDIHSVILELKGLGL